jgi:hypothetical protein
MENDRVLYIFSTNEEFKYEFDSKEMKDSEAFKTALCLFDCGDHYTVVFQNLKK